MVNLTNVSNLDEYYEKLNYAISMSNMWNTLETKSEYGASKSERGYQMIARSMAGKIANSLHLNQNLAQILTTCNGTFFPTYGQAGKKAVLQYLKDNNIQISESELAKEFIEMQLTREGNKITPEFDSMLTELFDYSSNPTTPEVQVARICAKTIDSVKRIEQLSSINQVDLLYNISKDTVESCGKSGKPVLSEKLQELLKLVPNVEPSELTEEQKAHLYRNIDVFHDYYKDDSKLKSACRFIAADAMEL